MLLLNLQADAVLPATHGGAWAKAPRFDDDAVSSSQGVAKVADTLTGEMSAASRAELLVAQRQARVAVLRACASALIDVQRLCARAEWPLDEAKAVLSSSMDDTDSSAVRVSPQQVVLAAALDGLRSDENTTFSAAAAAAAARALSGIDRCLAMLSRMPGSTSVSTAPYDEDASPRVPYRSRTDISQTSSQGTTSSVSIPVGDPGAQSHASVPAGGDSNVGMDPQPLRAVLMRAVQRLVGALDVFDSDEQDEVSRPYYRSRHISPEIHSFP